MTLFLKTLSRFWPIWAVYLFIWLLSMPLAIGSSLSWAVNAGSPFSMAQTLQYTPLAQGVEMSVVMSGVFCCVSAMAVYSFLYSARSVSAYGSLPLDRRCLFISVSLAGLLPLVAANVIVFLVTVAVEASLATVYMPALLSWLGMSTLTLVFYFGFSAFCAMLTGNLVVLPLVYAVLNFTAVAVESLVKYALDSFVYGFSSHSELALSFLSPPMQMIESGVVETLFSAPDALGNQETLGYVLHGWGVFGAYAAAGLALTVCACVLLRRRPMESAGDVVAVRALRPVFKYCMALGSALAIGLLLFSTISSGLGPNGTESAYVMLALMLVGCFIGYFAAEMLLCKSFSVFRGGARWIGFGAACALIAFFIVSCETDLYGFERRVPDAGEVKSVSVAAGGESGITVSDPANVAAIVELHQSLVDGKAFHETTGDGVYHTGLTVDYLLSDGRHIERYYAMAYTDQESSDVYELQRIMNTDEVISARKATDFPVTQASVDYAYVEFAVPGDEENYWQSMDLTAQEAYELYTDCLLPEIASGALGRIWLIEDEEYISSVYSAVIHIECSRRGSDGRSEYVSFYTVPTVDSTLTNAWLASRGIELKTYGECGALPFPESMTDSAAYKDDLYIGSTLPVTA